RLLVLLASMPQDQLVSVLDKLAACLPPDDLFIAISDETAKSMRPDLHILPAVDTKATWTVTAADYASALQLARENDATAALMLGPQSDSLSLQGLRNLTAAAVSGDHDLSISRYDLPPRAGLVNS